MASSYGTTSDSLAGLESYVPENPTGNPAHKEVDGPSLAVQYEQDGRDEAQYFDETLALTPLHGCRLTVVMFVMCLGLFLTMVETTITATALISIGNYFNESLKVTWVVLSYLLTYMGLHVPLQTNPQLTLY